MVEAVITQPKKSAKAVKPKPRKVKKAVASKLTYKELLQQMLTQDEWIEEDKILSRVVCKKYGVTRAKAARKRSVLNILNAGVGPGEFRRAKDGIRSFWRLGDGTPAADMLEAELLALCYKKLKNADYISLQARTREELESRSQKDRKGGFGSLNPYALLKYAGIIDFSWIITDNWEYFCPPLENNKPKFISKMNELNSFRRLIAHPNLENFTVDELYYFIYSVRVFIKNFSD